VPCEYIGPGTFPAGPAQRKISATPFPPFCSYGFQHIGPGTFLPSAPFYLSRYLSNYVEDMVDEVSRGESPVSKATGTNTGE
jgi:hypothetical protein